MRCMECGKEMQFTTAPMTEIYRGEKITVKGIEHYVCECGNDEMTATEATKLAHALASQYAKAHELLSPKKHVAKTYYARIEGKVTAEDVTAFRKGLDIGEKNLTKPAELVILKSDSESEIEVTITEGKYHQIKRMFEKTGKKVIYLKRLSMGSLKLDETLATGAYRPLTESELQALKEG